MSPARPSSREAAISAVECAIASAICVGCFVGSGLALVGLIALWHGLMCARFVGDSLRLAGLEARIGANDDVPRGRPAA